MPAARNTHISNFIRKTFIKRNQSWCTASTLHCSILPLLYEIFYASYLKKKFLKQSYIFKLFRKVYNWFCPCTLYIYFKCIFKVKKGNLHNMFLSLYTFIFLYQYLISTPFQGPKFWNVIKYFVKCVLVVTENIDR